MEGGNSLHSMTAGVAGTTNNIYIYLFIYSCVWVIV